MNTGLLIAFMTGLWLSETVNDILNGRRQWLWFNLFFLTLSAVCLVAHIIHA